MKNKLFDINKLPMKEGILVFGISMSKISNIQNAKKCFEYMNHFIPKVIKPMVGLNFLYSDNLYYYSNDPAVKLKKKYEVLVSSHKYEFLKILKKFPAYIPKSFSFTTWSQQMLESNNFAFYLGKLQKKYKDDKKFKKLVQKDIRLSGRRVNSNNVNYILEEVLMFYLISKGKVRLHNDYIQDKEKWILLAYPGKPLFSEIYFFQKNWFKLENPKNKYENCYYDLEEQKLYNYDRLDLEGFIKENE
jgi:hypothetical protein